MEPVASVVAALRYPWNGGNAGVTLVVGGVLMFLSPLVVPAIAVIGYGLRVVEARLEEDAAPPGFSEPIPLLLLGSKGLVVIIGFVVVPVLVATVGLLALAGAAGFRLRGGLSTLWQPPTAGGLLLVIVFLLAGLVLVVAYLTPAALVTLGRTRRLRAAFRVREVRRLVGTDAYGSAWLLALAVFALAGIVLALLNVAAIGVMVSGFVTFYAFVAMAYLYAAGTIEAEVEGELADAT